MSNRQLARDMQVEFQARVRFPPGIRIGLSVAPTVVANAQCLPVPSKASSSRSPKSRQAGSALEETDPGPTQEGRDGQGVPEGQDAAVEAGSRPADGPDGRYGRVERRPDPGQQQHEPHDPYDGPVFADHERRPEEHESGKGV